MKCNVFVSGFDLLRASMLLGSSYKLFVSVRCFTFVPLEKALKSAFLRNEL